LLVIWLADFLLSVKNITFFSVGIYSILELFGIELRSGSSKICKFNRVFIYSTYNGTPNQFDILLSKNYYRFANDSVSSNLPQIWILNEFAYASKYSNYHSI